MSVSQLSLKATKRSDKSNIFFINIIKNIKYNFKILANIF